MPRPATQLDGRKLCASTPAESGLPWPSLRTSAAFSHSSGANSMTSASADPVDRLKELMKARKEESLQVLSGWIEKREDPA